MLKKNKQKETWLQSFDRLNSDKGSLRNFDNEKVRHLRSNISKQLELKLEIIIGILKPTEKLEKTFFVLFII